jgi:hypothetical protein
MSAAETIKSNCAEMIEKEFPGGGKTVEIGFSFCDAYGWKETVYRLQEFFKVLFFFCIYQQFCWGKAGNLIENFVKLEFFPLEFSEEKFAGTDIEKTKAKPTVFS